MKSQKRSGLPVSPKATPEGSQGAGQKRLTTSIPAIPSRNAHITVQTDTGPLIIEAKTWGPLAVHPAVGKEGHSVTHIATGLALMRCPTEMEAIAVVDEIRTAGLSMDFRKVQDIAPATKQRLFEICRLQRQGSITVSVSVEFK